MTVNCCGALRAGLQRSELDPEAHKPGGVTAVDGGPAILPCADVTGGALAAVSVDDAGDEASSPTPCTVGANRTLIERTPRSASASAACSEAARVEAAVSVFRVAFERWLQDESDRDFALFVDDAVAELRTVAAGLSAWPRRRA